MTYARKTLDRQLRNPPRNPGRYRGRGIVISAGAFYPISGFIAVRSLRAAGCALPIQLWHPVLAEFEAGLERAGIRFT
jgi:hypothetical protein